MPMTDMSMALLIANEIEWKAEMFEIIINNIRQNKYISTCIY